MVNPPTQRMNTLDSGELSDYEDHIGHNGDIREYGSPERYSDRHSVDRYSVDKYNEQQQFVQPTSAQFTSRSPLPQSPPPRPDSRLSDTQSMDFPDVKNTTFKRRKTLPSIVKHNRSFSASKINTTSNPPIMENPSGDDTDTFIIENGIHKKIHAEVYARPPSPTPSITSTTSYVEEPPKELPKRYTVDTSLAASKNRGSLPDVREAGKTKQIMPREEAHRLGHARREELRKLREQEEARRKLEIVLRLSDVKVRGILLRIIIVLTMKR
jgi:hypothetical protein